jgi:hypothetical protein
LRIEFGPKDFENKTFVLVKRNTGEKKLCGEGAVLF